MKKPQNVRSMYNMKFLSAGYLKDAMASFGFLLSGGIIYFLKDLEAVRILILCILGIAFGIDSLFTVYPWYHSTEIGHNIPTYIVVVGFCIGIVLLVAFRKSFVWELNKK